MKLVTKAIQAKLLSNGAKQVETGNEDFVPVVRFFDPTGAATWLITECDTEEPDRMFGLCDLGMGHPELGWVSLRELQSVSGPLGLGIERDLWFDGEYPLSVYTKVARACSGIRCSGDALRKAAEEMAHG